SVLKWNFATTSFSGTTVEYSTNGINGWATKTSVTNANIPFIRYVRVTPTVNNLALFFLPVTGYTGTSATVKAQSVAGQVTKNSYPAGSYGVFPFSPIAHAYGTSAADVYNADSTHNFGFTVGQQYTLRWPSNPNTTNFNNVCDGDATSQW